MDTGEFLKRHEKQYLCTLHKKKPSSMESLAQNENPETELSDRLLKKIIFAL